jgi:hypothetical protein
MPHGRIQVHFADGFLSISPFPKKSASGKEAPDTVLRKTIHLQPSPFGRRTSVPRNRIFKRQNNSTKTHHHHPFCHQRMYRLTAASGMYLVRHNSASRDQHSPCNSVLQQASESSPPFHLNLNHQLPLPSSNNTQNMHKRHLRTSKIETGPEASTTTRGKADSRPG